MNIDRERLHELWDDFKGYFKRPWLRIKRQASIILADTPAEKPVVIAIDLNGGDYSPRNEIRAIKRAINRGIVREEEIIAVGDTNAITLLKKEKSLQEIRTVVCADTINMGDKEEEIRKKRQHATMATAIRLVRDGIAQGCVSAGSTMALVIYARLYLGKIPGVAMPAIAGPIPNIQGGCLFLDMGASLKVTPDDLLNFAIMGKLYAQKVWGLEDPAIRLLNVGSEETKGTQRLIDAHKSMKSSEHLNFGGNIDANMVFFDAVNVVVCSAEHGNILIKGAEGGANYLKYKLGFIWKIIAFLWGHRQRSDAKEIGGCLIVGVRGNVVKPHGNSPPIAIANGIRQAKHGFQMGIVSAITDYYAKMAQAEEAKKAT